MSTRHVSFSFSRKRKVISTTRDPNASFVPLVEIDDLIVISNEHVGDAYWHLVLAAPPTHTAAVPGQFFHIACPSSAAGKPFLRRPMSIYSVDPELSRISFLYKVTGVGTSGLATLGANDRVSVVGPLGVGFSINPDHDHTLIVARGVGLATMGPLAEALAAAGVAVTTVCSSRSPEAAIGTDGFAIHGEVISLYDSDGSSDMDTVRRLIREIHYRRSIDAVYTCGSKRLSHLLKDLARDHGFIGQVALEQQMACGLGMCHACVVDRLVDGVIESARVCTAGPVFGLLEMT